MGAACHMNVCFPLLFAGKHSLSPGAPSEIERQTASKLLPHQTCSENNKVPAAIEGQVTHFAKGTLMTLIAMAHYVRVC